MPDSRTFTRWVNRLCLQVDQLEQKIKKARRKVEAERLEKEINTRRANLRHLYDYATQHRLNLNRYHYQLNEIRGSLEKIEETLKRRKRPWWKKALSYVSGALSFLASLFGFLGPILSALGLPGHSVAGLLTSRDSSSSF